MKPGMNYGILAPCYRCTYQKSHEPILIFSLYRGPRVIVNLEGKSYVRFKDCLGLEKCNKCFDQCKVSSKDLPCEWKEI